MRLWETPPTMWTVGKRQLLLDALGGVAFAGFLVGVTPWTQVAGFHTRGLNALGYALLAICGLALSFRRAKPFVGYVVAIGSATTYLALAFPGWPVYIGAVIGFLLLIQGTQRSFWLRAGIPGLLAVVVASGRPSGWSPTRMAFELAVGVLLGVLAAETATHRARRAEADARQRLAEERLRIAQELHDVLSHSLATISLQAGVGLHLLETTPEQARDSLTTIRAVSTEALTQARVALDVIRQPGDQPPVTAAPSLADLEALAASVRSTGVQVDMHIDNDTKASSVVGEAAYRVVQESLTNVMRHAGPGAHASVSITHEGQLLVVEVSDNGRGGAAESTDPPNSAATGHGLQGMRERVAALGGSLHAGPGPAGGYQVRAQLPLIRESRLGGKR